MSIMDKSIASRIALLLGLFCLVLCAFLISLLQLLKMLSEEADETVNVALPNMAIASYISKESEWAKGILHDSILCRDRFVHLGVVQEIEARRFPGNVLESLEALAVDPGIKEKIKNKRGLQKELGLAEDDKKFMIGIVSRLTDQKGLDLVQCVMDEICTEDVQLVVLGTGDERYENMFRHYDWKYNDRVSANIYYSEDMSHKVYAACDAFLMP